MATAEELDLDDDEDTAGSGSSSAISLHSISVGELRDSCLNFNFWIIISAGSDGEAVEADQEIIEDEDDDDEDEESDDDSDDDGGSDAENEDLYAELAMEQEADKLLRP